MGEPHVSEAILHVNIWKVRATLGDDADMPRASPAQFPMVAPYRSSTIAPIAL
jgi:hypothetical protein